MKLLTVLLIILLGLATPAWAEDWHSICGKISQVAEVVMKNRQNGISMQKMIEASKTNSGALDTLAEEIVIKAYSQPKYSTDKMQQNSINEFRDESYLSCVKGFKK